ncbi:MAG: hypothetical protein IKI97_10080 [Clostridia bacterium]|nr:hypothetical protein [Clostridia bacterium]
MQENTKRLFTQKELEKHINSRLIRERKKNRDLELFKGMVDKLISSGAIDADSYAEAGERLAGLLANSSVGNSEDKADGKVCLKNSATDSTESSEDEATGDAVEETAESEKTPDAEIYGDENAGTADTLAFEEQNEKVLGEESSGKEDLGIDALSEETMPEENVQEGKPAQESEDLKLRFSKLCADFEKIIEDMSSAKAQVLDTETENMVDDGFFARRNASSTGFSSKSAVDAASSGFELTPVQRDIARRAGISYREYAELLREIPENNKKRRQYR